MMMNPGGSEPDLSLIKTYTEDQIDADDFYIDFKKKKLVRAIPDETQYRIMNVMNVKAWRHVRVLNLSDVREINSQFLKEHLKNFNDCSDKSIHSIFCAKRIDERRTSFNLDDVPILILGWGAEYSLRKLAESAYSFIKSLPDITYIGIQPEEYLFYHPQRRKDWHDDILDQIFKSD